jgi:hypothetical protein
MDNNSKLGEDYKVSFGREAHPENFVADYELSAAGNGKLESGHPLWCLKIAKHKGYEASYWLILRSMEGSDKSYQRIGLARPRERSLPEHLAKRKVVIIE